MIIQERSRFNKLLKSVSPTRIIIFSFIIIIAIGGILLSLPIASKGEPLSIINAFFIATSATCVTGLTMYDTYRTFTLFGQITILLLIQLGGLGLATFATSFTLLFRRKLGFRDLILLSEAAGSDNLNLISLLKIIISTTFISESIGSLLLMIKFVPMCGKSGIWISVFLAVSAFCNSGFDILGFIEGNASLTAFSDDPLVCMTIAVLIFIGGLGFLVVQDIYISKIKPGFTRKRTVRLSFHSRVCLAVSSALVLIGTVLFFIFECENTMKGMSLLEMINTSIFQSINTRTSGFYSVDLSAEHDITKIITIILMFIGGSPGSTAGGIKVSTFIVIVSAVVSTFKNRDDAVFLGHRFNKKLVYKSITVTLCGVLLVIIDTCLITYFNNPGETIDVLFETVSAFATVGITAGVTSELNLLGKLLIMLTMFIGRVGPVSFGIAVMTNVKKTSEPILPEGRMLIG